MRCMAAVTAVGFVLALATSAGANSSWHVAHDFETDWTGDYAPGWESTGYRHGDAPIAKMRQVDLIAYGRSGSGAEVYMDSVAEDWQWWANVTVSSIPTGALDVQYDPWVSVDMYDAGYDPAAKDVTGQLYTLPSWVVDDDWTDVQFGGRPEADSEAEGSYYYTWADSPHPGWQEVDSPTRPDASEGEDGVWRELKIQLLSSDNKLHYYLDGTEVGVSTRDDYMDLGALDFHVRFRGSELSDWPDDAPPAVVIDNYEYGSAVPEPATMAGVLAGVAGIGAYIRKRRMA